MKPLVEQARNRLGSLPEGGKSCMAILAVFRQDYDIANVKTISSIASICFPGDLTRHITDFLGKTKIKLQVIRSQFW